MGFTKVTFAATSVVRLHPYLHTRIPAGPLARTLAPPRATPPWRRTATARAEGILLWTANQTFLDHVGWSGRVGPTGGPRVREGQQSVGSVHRLSVDATLRLLLVLLIGYDVLWIVRIAPIAQGERRGPATKLVTCGQRPGTEDGRCGGPHSPRYSKRGMVSGCWTEYDSLVVYAVGTVPCMGPCRSPMITCMPSWS